MINTSNFDEHKTLEHLKHYLPAQAALKDFVHHNTLHAFQSKEFHKALWEASVIFGYRTYIGIDEFRERYHKGMISPAILDRVIDAHFSTVSEKENWKEKLLQKQYNKHIHSRLNQFYDLWKLQYKVNLPKVVHPLLFRLLAAYLDQGIADWKFPSLKDDFLDSLRDLEQNGYISLFKAKRARRILLENKKKVADLLAIVVGDEAYFEQYLFEQQFNHPGWSGFVSVVEHKPKTLFDERKISLQELIYFELLLEIDALDHKFGEMWKPLMIQNEGAVIQDLFGEVPYHEIKTVLQLWQEALEWSYFDSVLSGILLSSKKLVETKHPSFQGLFCIDDREYSLRRHIEALSPTAQTFGTPGYFGIEFYFQPENGKFLTLACPANIDPKYIIKEVNRKKNIQKDPHFHQSTHKAHWGGLISGTLGFWSAMKLLFNLFRPSISPLTVHSFQHADKQAGLQIDFTGEQEEGRNIGFKPVEMANRVEKVLKSIGLTQDFVPIVYLVGHGGSSVNNTYYAGYDCGACAGRPGAVNARVFAYMANKKEVRDILQQNGLNIPQTTCFVGAMHDTTRDEIEFYDEEKIPKKLQALHQKNEAIFKEALMRNALERSYRFENINSAASLHKVHHKVKKRSISLFEPRPEWNHTDNALCIIGRKSLYDKLYLDKRPFLNSYDYTQDENGELLHSILSATIPVCGGINLEYYFSTVDQQKLGAGTKLPHNVVGLFGLNTGVDGDLRTGLPSQMIEIHEPVRILFVIEQFPEVIDNVISKDKSLKEWVHNEWVLLTAIHPETKKIYRFSEQRFSEYTPVNKSLKRMTDEQAQLDVINKKEPALMVN
ncbi:DUF2309 domain-containing protein [Marivirga sp. S37H4]|uniref:Probable inorganic carbon transporter subunit DabA n=1 Tax=Marivirga aurantiaca TaxID=2802615 RepID=A0A935C6V8_9BACT|nr:DUF2309 domain-containing protein [Marivirga aurantiaca]MBK6264579.1 DUF2309 domain-containing protein [Marivirga aurantiaca]